MTGFGVDWLRLREPFDHAAREPAAAALHTRLARWRQARAGAPLAVFDLGCGHGANLRALAPRLGAAQRWRLLDHDAALLAELPRSLASWARGRGYRLAAADSAGDGPALDLSGPGFDARLVCRRLDLAHGLAGLDFGASSLVTASALLDLVSAPWLQALIDRAGAADAALWFALNVDGRTNWCPADPADATVQALFERHQLRDKGFGPALGPQAAALALKRLRRAGYRTLQAQTDWVIDGAEAPAMAAAMIEGMAAAALESEPAAGTELRAWKARRAAGLRTCSLRVGHLDVLATPAQAGARRSRSQSKSDPSR